ncbi:hypothetical protein Nepgr_001868 [Nepenthes gracilis]|uniref:Uncharacterized protein n=1 Tax=Nepenthes gracilis TaxID=150966 RepID=A0AAD3P579_NEPGR|nr:hypothetical protein Nepgr_001868 [Nepenthes gracilis]
MKQFSMTLSASAHTVYLRGTTNQLIEEASERTLLLKGTYIPSSVSSSLSSHIMSKTHLIVIILIIFSSNCCFAALRSPSLCCTNNHILPKNQEFKQQTNRFFQFEEQSNSWVEVELPYELVTCVNGNCSRVGLIYPAGETAEYCQGQANAFPENTEILKTVDNDHKKLRESYEMLLPKRKRVSLTKISETSIWVTGESGSIYERFWNGVRWVIVPHDLPESAGHAISIFTVNQTLLALSEAGFLYQIRWAENSQPVWVEFATTNCHTATGEEKQQSLTQIKSGVVSHDSERIYFCTKNGSLLELAQVEPPRWVYHGRPPGADVAAVADAATVRPKVVFTISSAGDLYEYDKNTKPPWKKHIWRDESASDTSLIPAKGCNLLGLSGAFSRSLFLIAKTGKLVERRLLHQRKWKWIKHGSPEDHILTSITPVSQDELNEQSYSLLLTTAAGSVFEYQVAEQSGAAQEQQIQDRWTNHKHPLNGKAARGIAGLQYQAGRILFPLDDGRLAELHLAGMGGENWGPTYQVNIRRKATLKYVWSILDAPESEGWNAEYCIEERGPSNCISGIKDEATDIGTTWPMARRRKGQAQTYLALDALGSSMEKSLEAYKFPHRWVNSNFRLRVMHKGRSFFLITDGGQTFEFLYNDNFWLWLQHDHPTSMEGAVGSYNGSLFLVDRNGSLLIRERTNNELGWINCTAMRKGKEIASGPPWDGVPGTTMKAKAEDALFFVSKTGRLLQLNVFLGKFKWKDGNSPPNTKIASIVDQEGLRKNILFVIGKNGRLYQYNKLSELWHEHSQSQHLVLSRLPGTVMRPSALSLKGSLFMMSEDGGLVEYHWNTMDGWAWVEHGTPHAGVSFAGAPGPSFGGNQLFLIGVDGNIYLRYWDGVEWRWKNYRYPYAESTPIEGRKGTAAIDDEEGTCVNRNFAISSEDEDHINLSQMNVNCNPKVASTRSISFADDSVIFELRDGRLAEMRRIKDFDWVWSRTIATPTSLCTESYWTAPAS